MKVFFEKKNLKFELEAAAAHHYYLDEDGHVDEHGGGGDQRSGMAEQRIGGICTTKTQSQQIRSDFIIRPIYWFSIPFKGQMPMLIWHIFHISTEIYETIVPK